MFQKPVNAAIGGAVGAAVGGAFGGGNGLVMAATTGVGAALGCKLDPVGMLGYPSPASDGAYDVKLALGSGAAMYLLQSMGYFAGSAVTQGAVSGAAATTVVMLSGY